MNKCDSIWNFIKCIIYLIFPFINLINTNNKIDKEIEKIKKINYTLTKKFESPTLFYELTKLNNKEFKRKDSIENKGKSILLIITLSGTLLIGTIDILYQQYHLNLLLIILIIGILYLIISVLTVLPLVITIQFNDLYIDDLYNLTECKNDSSIKLNFDAKNIDQIIAEMFKNIKLNQLYLLKQSNNLSSTISTIKISFILIFIFLLLTAVNVFVPGLLPTIPSHF